MVRAYLLALDKGIPGEVYNIGSGKTVKIGDVLRKLISFSKVKIKVKQDKSLFRPADIKKIYCNFSKFHAQTGWKPKIPLLKTLSDTIEYERQKL
jgi:GDP-4-dehydro-6-deoxy-D-mannose reductase